ncbi:unnamed protein product [Linum trigynum]|uniref:Uncharacterized protein n=1 Tax=Linum trigynum TaxID=586398 RepID=A0AAV2GKB5_9ROSI
MRQCSGAQSYPHQFMGLNNPSLPFYNQMGQGGFLPKPNYMNTWNENGLINQAQLPLLFWDNRQIEAQYLSHWGLKQEQSRKKLKASRKRKSGVCIKEHSSLQNQVSDKREEAEDTNVGKVEMAHLMP